MQGTRHSATGGLLYPALHVEQPLPRSPAAWSRLEAFKAVPSRRRAWLPPRWAPSRRRSGSAPRVRSSRTCAARWRSCARAWRSSRQLLRWRAARAAAPAPGRRREPAAAAARLIPRWGCGRRPEGHFRRHLLRTARAAPRARRSLRLRRCRRWTWPGRCLEWSPRRWLRHRRHRTTRRSSLSHRQGQKRSPRSPRTCLRRAPHTLRSWPSSRARALRQGLPA
jgi:hypothetical protein